MKKNIFIFLGLLLILGVSFIPYLYSKDQKYVYNIGTIGDYPIGTIFLVPSARVLVISDTEGIYAVSAVCTHRGCLIKSKKGVLMCPCHGAQFDLNGKVINGPARDNLAWYPITMDTLGSLTLDTSKTIPAGTKLILKK